MFSVGSAYDAAKVPVGNISGIKLLFYTNENLKPEA
jgi:hypothetical protein